MTVTQGNGYKNRILSYFQLNQVHEYTIRLLEEVGCKVYCKEALDILDKAGCDVSKPDQVRIPQKLVMEAIEAAPKKIKIYNRDGDLSMVLKEGKCYYGPGSDCPYTIDLYTGKRRISKKEDVALLARFCDALPNIDFVMSFGIANDAPEGSNFVHQYQAMLMNTKKPIIVTGHGRNDMMTMIEMAAVSLGGIEKVKKTPPIILYTEPLSPLVHTEMGLIKGFICCEYDIPFIYIGSPMMGASSPVTLEGTLVQTIAESLAGLVIFQNKKPGAKFIFGGDASVMDMNTAIYSYGAPELNILNAALADMAHYYRLPFFCIAGASDSKILDAQAGLEYAMSIYDATLNQCNIIHDCGYLEYGLTSSFESLLFADEIISMVKHMLLPLRFNNKTVPLKSMGRVKPGGSFLMDDHTLNNFRKTLWFPRFLDRKVFEIWEKYGSKDARMILKENAKKILNEHKPQELSEAKIREISNVAAKHQPDVE